MNKYQSIVVPARTLLSGMVLYHGGQIATVVGGRVLTTVTTTRGLELQFRNSERVRIYRNL